MVSESDCTTFKHYLDPDNIPQAANQQCASGTKFDVSLCVCNHAALVSCPAGCGDVDSGGGGGSSGNGGSGGGSAGGGVDDGGECQTMCLFCFFLLLYKLHNLLLYIQHHWQIQEVTTPYFFFTITHQ